MKLLKKIFSNLLIKKDTPQRDLSTYLLISNAAKTTTARRSRSVSF
ncbi:MAG: hypothetical protein K0R93_723 [Anaerosolibacter sp.]|nr:hypothetical protein [Anaerosolibacter sp.]